MSLRDGPLRETKGPVRWPAVVALALAAVGAFALAFGHFGRTTGAGAYGALRQGTERAARPAGEALSAPVRWSGAVFSALGAYFFAGTQNRALKAELVQARHWKNTALALAEENARYRALMGVKTDPPIPMVFARTILDARGPFARTRLADAGADRGVMEGAPVLGERGLIGRVMGVAPQASRILLLTDTESRTPVMVARTNARAILTGDGGPNPALAYLRTHDPLRAGDRVMTSGDGGVFPRGLPVGAVVKSGAGAWRVALDADSGPIDYVQILLFKDFSQLVDTRRLVPKNLPSAMTEEPSATILGNASAAPTAGAPADSASSTQP